ncbi:MAG: DUF3054 domain-containing protein [Armatimonadetes bacterium]|nr:DUF3054 domain-containing protein [Armatimonadota bacterium]
MYTWYRWADALSLVAFSLVGRAHHAASLVGADLLGTLAPFLLAWFVVAAVVGTYRDGGVRRLLANWAIAVPIAVVVRQSLRGQPFSATFWQFLVVALVMTLGFLAIGRFFARRVRARPT